MRISAGSGLSPAHNNGGDGGLVDMRGGNAEGTHSGDDGGDVLVRPCSLTALIMLLLMSGHSTVCVSPSQLTGGMARAGRGGDLSFSSGIGIATSSGEVQIATANAGEGGTSGSMTLTTGTSSVGSSGFIVVTTGDALSGSGGAITVAVGKGESGCGSDVAIEAGATSDVATGGAISLTSGGSELTSSGPIEVRAAFQSTETLYHFGGLP